MMIKSVLFPVLLSCFLGNLSPDAGKNGCRPADSVSEILSDGISETSGMPLAIADPYVLYDEVAGVYYAYGTTAPDGFKTFVSTDLVNWCQARTPLGDGYVLRKGNSVFGDANFWAPEVWKIGNTYYMLYTADFSLCVARSDSPLGPFVQPSGPYCLVHSAIDHTLCIDDRTGDYYLCFNSTRNGRNSVYMAKVEKDFSSMAPESEWELCLTTEPGTWEEIQNQIIEGPFIIPHEGKYYLTYSANDYRSQDYAVGYAVSDTLFPGKWKKSDSNPILRRPGNLVGTGHSSFFTGADGQLYIVFHAHPDRKSCDPRHMYVSKAWFGKDGVLEVDGNCFPAYLTSEQVTLDNPVLPRNAADPSLLDDRERSGYYYLYTTENGECDIPVYRSGNLVDWEFVGDAFPDGYRRKWGESWALPWAPDINYINGKYVLYYSMGCWNEPLLSESGVAVSDSPEGPFTDVEGNPLLSRENCRVFNPIDVNFFDDGERKYIFWGSYRLSDDPSVDYGIYAMEVTDDGLAVKEGASKIKVAGNQIEGAMVMKKDGRYYLFASTGRTLAGRDSDYRVVVGRSDNVLGPYVGPDGTPMLDNDGYDNYILSGDGTAFFGTGHNSGIVTDDAGQDWVAYHTLWAGNNLGARVLCVDKIMWDNGWPRLVTGHPVTNGAGPVFKINY